MSGCDFCGAEVKFERETIEGSAFWHLVPVEKGAGSDHLATWCASCGPQHRFPK